MPDLIVITFDNPDEAGQVREAIKKAEGRGQISLDDSAVVVRDAAGKVHVKNQLDRGVKVGAVAGGIVGLLIGGIFFPLAGLLTGVAGGAAVGALTDLGLQKSFVNEVAESLGPDGSALFVIVREAAPEAAIATLRPYKGEIYHTSLTPDMEETLRQVLKERK
jgi:uncharacterized membrane protein